MTSANRAVRIFSRILVSLSLASVVACSSLTPTPDRVISFGDSLSDLGTYVDRTDGKTEGRYTTNPGPVWIEVVASSLRTTIAGYRRAGWGHPEQILGGFGYAEGGSRVALQPGSNNTDETKGIGSGNTTMPLSEQVALHLKRDSIRDQDLVLLWAGANDVLRHGFLVPVKTQDEGDRLVREAAAALAVEARRIATTAKPRVVVLTIDNYGEVPGFRGSPASNNLTRLSNVFNDELRSRLKGTSVLLVDVGQLLIEVRKNPGAYGLKDATSAACTISSLPFRSALFCTKQTLVEPNADSTYLYADSVHFTSGGSRLIADAVLRALNR